MGGCGGMKAVLKAADEKLQQRQVKKAGAALTTWHFMLWWWWRWWWMQDLSACFLGPTAPAISPLLPPPPSRWRRHRRVNTWQNRYAMSTWNWDEKMWVWKGCFEACSFCSVFCVVPFLIQNTGASDSTFRIQENAFVCHKIIFFLWQG